MTSWVDILFIWAIGFSILVLLGREIGRIRQYEREQNHRYWNRHHIIYGNTSLIQSVAIRQGIPTDSMGDEMQDYIGQQHEKFRKEYREFKAGQKDRNLKKLILGLISLCDAVAIFALFFYFL